MSQKIVIKVIDHKNHRYPTVGDWEFIGENDLVIRVSELGDLKMNYLASIHELVEALLCKFASPEVTGKEVDEFDMKFEKDRKENDDSEPGDQPYAPYHNQHKVATFIEMLLADTLEVSWADYEKRINSL